MTSVGIIGFGRIGREHAGWIARAGLRVGGVFDPTPERCELARAMGLNLARTLDALSTERAIDAVLISTPNSMHFEHASRALRAGKHVMVEKPMALDHDQAAQLVAMSKSAGRVLSVFHNRRWDIDHLTVKAAIDSGIFGTVFNVESRLGQWSSCVGPAAQEWRPGWRNESAFGGGGLFDWGSHFLDQLWQLMLPARAVRVFAQLRGNAWTKGDPSCDDFARVCIDFDNGATGLVEINTTTTRPLPRWHIDGTRGSADSPFSLSFETREWAKLTFAPSDGGASHQLPLSRAGLTEVQIWEKFAAACRRESEPAVTAESVLPTMMLLDAARKSSRTGCTVGVTHPASR
jgi:predicted dehydrogenase